MKNPVPEILKDFQEKHDLKNTHMALMLGVPAHRYSEYVNGKREPSKSFIIKMRKVLRVDINTLIDSIFEIEED